MLSTKEHTVERVAWTNAWWLFNHWIPKQCQTREAFSTFVQNGTIEFSNECMDRIDQKAQRMIRSHEGMNVEVLEDLCKKSLMFRKLTSAHLSTLSERSLRMDVRSKRDVLNVVDDLRLEIHDAVILNTDAADKAMIKQIYEQFKDLRFTHCPTKVELYASQPSNANMLLMEFLKFCNPHKEFPRRLSEDQIRFRLVDPDRRKLYASFEDRTVVHSQIWFKLMVRQRNGRETLDWICQNDWAIARGRLKTVRKPRKTVSGWSDDAKWRTSSDIPRGLVSMSSQMIRINTLRGNLIHGHYARLVNLGAHGDLHKFIRKPLNEAAGVQLLVKTGNTQDFQGVPCPQAPPLSPVARVSQMISQECSEDVESINSVETSESDDDTWVDQVLEVISEYVNAFGEEWVFWNLSQLSAFKESHKDGQEFMKLGLECFLCAVLDTARSLCLREQVIEFVHQFHEVLQFEATRSILIFLGVIFRFPEHGIVDLEAYLDLAVEMGFSFWLDTVEHAGHKMGISAADMPAWIWRVTARILGTEQINRVADMAVRCEINDEVKSRLNLRRWKEYERMTKANRESIPRSQHQTTNQIRNLLCKQSLFRLCSFPALPKHTDKQTPRNLWTTFTVWENIA